MSFMANYLMLLTILAINMTKKHNHITYTHILCVLISLWLMHPFMLKAQHNQSNTTHFNMENGLACNNITAIIQDSHGYIWIGTDDGLQRFDGYTFTTYRNIIGDTASISGNMISDIVETADGNIWVGTREHGVSQWNRKTDKFTQLNNRKNLTEPEIQGMSVIDNQVYVMSRNFLSIINPSSKKVDPYPILGTPAKKHETHKLFIVPTANRKHLMIGGSSQYQIFDNEKRIFIPTNPKAFSVGKILQIATFGEQIVMSTTKEIDFFDTELQLTETIKKQPMFEGSHCTMHSHSDSLLLLACSNKLLTIKPDRHSPEIAIENLLKTDEIGNRNINSMILDDNNNLWVGTQFNGLIRIDLKAPKFNPIPAVNPGVIQPVSGSMSFTADGSIIYAAARDGIAISKRVDGRFFANPTFYQVEEHEVTTVMERKDGTIWAGTNSGIYILDKNHRHLSPFSIDDGKNPEPLTSTSRINSLTEDHNGHIWIASPSGLFRYDNNDVKRFLNTAAPGSAPQWDWINTLFEDNGGWLWIGTKEGLRYRKPNSEEFVIIKNTPRKGTNLSGNDVISFAQLSDDQIVIGTRTGITLYSKKASTFTIWPGNHLLHNEVINSVATDLLKQIWIGTNNSAIVATEKYDLFNFHLRDGLRNTSFAQGGIINHNGTIYLGGIKGIDCIKPNKLMLNKKVKQPAITCISVVHQDKEIHRVAMPDSSLSLRYKSNLVLNISLSALDYSFPERNQYKVFLEGHDNGWSKPTNNNVVTYYNLPPGQYTLRVMATNGDEKWNTAPTNFNIRIVPPLWRTKYAIAFYILIVIIMLHILSNYRIFKMRKAFKALEEKADAKLKFETQRNQIATVHQRLKDSISYAKRIQEAMIPSEEVVRQIFPSSFVYFRPKDIVSGDFYWAFENDEKQIMIAADCTGHGVPGAFMSIIGMDILRNTIEQQQEFDPAAILSHLNRAIHQTFSNSNNNHHDENGNGHHINDGMDIAVCVIDKKTRNLTFSGAISSMYLIRENEIITYKGNRTPIGSIGTEASGMFEKQEVELQPKDMIYLFSDGFADQFGGAEGKKFKYRRFRHLLLNIHKLPAEDQKNIIHQKYEEWIGTEYEQIDDVLIAGFAIQ